MAGRFPDRESVVVDGRRVTYAGLDRAANQLAHRLRDAGLRRGDALAVCAGNDPGVFEAFWAAMRLGLYLVPVNRHLRTAEIRHILTDVATLGRVAVVTDAGTDAEVEGAAGDLPLADRICAGDGALAPGFPDHLPAAWEGQLLLYSSGTSGRPKGVLRDLPDRRHGGGHGPLRPGGGPRPPGGGGDHGQPVGADHVRAPPRAARRRPGRLPGPLGPPPRLPRRRPLPGAGQAGHDRVVGADPGRVLQRHRRRPDHDHLGRLAGPPRLGGAPLAGRTGVDPRRRRRRAAPRGASPPSNAPKRWCSSPPCPARRPASWTSGSFGRGSPRRAVACPRPGGDPGRPGGGGPRASESKASRPRPACR